MIKIGSRVPDMVVYKIDNGISSSFYISKILVSTRTVVFGLPGAFTPTCHKEHLPSFIEKADEIFSKGIDKIICISVNDPFVMNEWGKVLGVGDKVLMVADASAELTKALGLDIDLSEFGLGIRSKRYSAFIDDCIVKEFQVEEDSSILTNCSADEMLKLL